MVLDMDAEARDEIVDDLMNTADDVINGMKLFGLLMTGQGKGECDRDADDIVELGYTLHGLGHMALQLIRAVEEINGNYLVTEVPHA